VHSQSQSHAAAAAAAVTAPIVLPRGFRASGITCGIKASGKPDLALFVSDTPASAAGVFTTNKVCGAPVIVSRERVPSAGARAVIVNSGNSNAATGEPGLADAREMTAAVARELGCGPGHVLVCSTGVIGVPLPMDKLRSGIPESVAALGTSDRHFQDAATAMMTTDTVSKLISVECTTSGGSVTVAGACKGAAMIAPNMATMLGVVLTDAALTPEQCEIILRHGVERTFNCISVDGHMSTSDTVLLLANGAVAGALDGSDLQQVQEAVQRVCQHLATSIIRDAEGADHFVTVDVSGLATREAAFRMAKEIAESALVKTAIAGGDPNWGRIVSAAGYAGVDFETAFVSLRINGTEVYRAGTPVPFDSAALSRELKSQREVHLDLRVSGGFVSGNESVRFWTSDLTAEYVRLNSEYTT
jgi:glutamate N-acetyltransferase / amino-acid N-acetyltransferase